LPEKAYEPKVVALWKKAVNTIIFKRIIKKYAPILLDLGVELDMDEFEDDDAEVEAIENGDKKDDKSDTRSKKGKTPEPKKSSSKTPTKQIEKLSITPTANQKKLRTLSLAKIKPMRETRDALPPIKKNESKTNDAKSKQTASSSIQPLPKINKDNKIKPDSMEIFNAGVSYFEDQFNKVRNNKNQNSFYAFKGDIKQETMQVYEKYCEGISPYKNAKKILNDANTFKSKSWLQQIYLGSQMVKGNALRRIKKYSELTSNSNIF
jgi:hypothetical protein